MQAILHTPRSIWVIDDDETALLLAEEVLTASGFQVRTFADAPSALVAAQTTLPRIIVVDVVMPGMDGFEFCAELRKIPDGAVIPVLVTTSLDDTASIDKAYQAGATNFATKPINWTIEIHRLLYMLKSADVAQEVRQQEQETRLAKADWERTFDSINDVVTVLDLDLKVLRANHATTQLLGKNMENILGRRCHELFYSGGEVCSGCPASRVQATGLAAAAEIRCNPVGALFEITISPVTDAQGRVIRLVHVARDLSEKKELEAELRQAQKMEAIGTLAGGIAHDFNNLLTVVQCCAEMILSDQKVSGLDTENLEAILDAAKRGSDLTRQLLIFSRKKSNTSQKRLMDLNDTLKSLNRMLEKGLPKTVLQHSCLAANLHKINADSGQLEQVVMNLAVNAAHAMRSQGSLMISTKNARLEADYCQTHPGAKPGEYVLLSVSDTGHGMDLETQARIYEPFFTTKPVGEGTGLGLSVVFGIVREHDGYITCQSEVGVGTTFQIYFPVVNHSGVKVNSVPAAGQTVPRGSGTILIVDDEAPIRAVLERHLVSLGYSVIAAGDGESALRRYSEAATPPCAVILDLGMPIMSGWECMEKLQRINPMQKVIVASGYTGDEMANRAFKQGALAFINKPYNLLNVSRKLREVLDNSSAKSESSHFHI